MFFGFMMVMVFGVVGDGVRVVAVTTAAVLVAVAVVVIAWVVLAYEEGWRWQW